MKNLPIDAVIQWKQNYFEVGVQPVGEYSLPMGISALACAIADTIPDEDELVVLAAVFTQLGDTLGTIAARRSLRSGNERSDTL